MVSAFESRTARLLGEAGMQRLRAAHVIVFGVGGVGGYVAEALARAGVGHLTLVDDDNVAKSNLNRQIIATVDTVGQPKIEVAAARVRSINPNCTVTPVRMFYLPETADALPLAGADYVVDAVDTVTAKLTILSKAQEAGVPAISCMGTGNKLHPELLQLTTIEKTQGCPLARIMRKECKKRGLKRVQVVYSPELARTPQEITIAEEDTPGVERPGTPKTQTPGSTSFVPGAAGLIIAGAVVRGICGLE